MSAIAARLREVFDLVDVARNEFISRAELRQLTVGLPLVHSAADLHAAVGDQRLSITWTEFEALMHQLLVDLPLEDLYQRIKAAATDMKPSTPASPESEASRQISETLARIEATTRAKVQAASTPSEQLLLLQQQVATLTLEKEILDRRTEDYESQLRDTHDTVARLQRERDQSHQEARLAKEELAQLRHSSTAALANLRDEAEKFRVKEYLQANEVQHLRKDVARLEEELEIFRRRERDWELDKERHRDEQRHWESERAVAREQLQQNCSEQDRIALIAKRMEEMRLELAFIGAQFEEGTIPTRRSAARGVALSNQQQQQQQQYSQRALSTADRASNADPSEYQPSVSEADQWYDRHLSRLQTHADRAIGVQGSPMHSQQQSARGSPRTFYIAQ